MSPPVKAFLLGTPYRIDSQYIARLHRNVTVDSDIYRIKEQVWEASLEDLVSQWGTMGWTM